MPSNYIELVLDTNALKYHPPEYHPLEDTVPTKFTNGLSPTSIHYRIKRWV